MIDLNQDPKDNTLGSVLDLAWGSPEESDPARRADVGKRTTEFHILRAGGQVHAGGDGFEATR